MNGIMTLIIRYIYADDSSLHAFDIYFKNAKDKLHNDFEKVSSWLRENYMICRKIFYQARLSEIAIACI